MAVSGTTETYINYEDYILYKVQFFIRSGKSLSTEDIENFMKSLKDIGYIYESIKSNFIIINEYFKVIKNKYSSMYNNKFCDYMNYWLKGQDKIYYTTNSHPISTYLIRYIKEHTSLAKEIGCKFEIGDAYNKEYEKKVKLYEIYDNYSSLVNFIELGMSDYLCTYVKNIIKLYNEILSIIKGNPDGDLLNELNNIRCMIEKNNLKLKVKCNNEFQELSEIISSVNYEKKCIISILYLNKKLYHKIIILKNLLKYIF
ncbi:variable surface protein, partial [Plasmodium gonderi]